MFGSIATARRWPHCGCFILAPEGHRKYIPLVKVQAHTLILSNASRTTLTQTFVNPLQDNTLKELLYEFPLYDGISVVSFTCTVAGRVIRGVVKERQKARETYDQAVAQGQTAGLLDQSLSAADVFSMRIGNVPAKAQVKVEIVFLGELKHDAEIDGLRFSLPTYIAERFGTADLVGTNVGVDGGLSVTVDVKLPLGSSVKTVQSPSHPISVQVGSCSTDSSDAEPSLQKASASLSMASTEMNKDFIIQVTATKLGDPSAVIETHPSIPNQRALMTTLVPKFNLPADKPEIVFMCDRSGSMNAGQQIPNLIRALNIFLKSLPVGIKFNICSFGSRHEFLWPKSQSYTQENLDRAVQYVNGFEANFGGTEMHSPMKDAFNRRYQDLNLEVFLLTDGEIWDQKSLFDLINEYSASSKGAIRVFSLGIGQGVSHSLIEGVARAGSGFSQTVADNEKMEKKVIRMLKGALTPHITDYALEIKYSQSEKGVEDEDDFDLIEKVEAITVTEAPTTVKEPPKEKAIISLFDTNINDNTDSPAPASSGAEGRYDHLPKVKPPTYLQGPYQIPSLFPFHRTNIYVLLSEIAPNKVPKAVLLKATSVHGPLQLEIPITTLPEKGEMIHQLAARKAVKELEEGRGWIFDAKDSTSGKLLKDAYEGRFSDMVEREAVRLGVTYQVGGKWCSFVAVGDDNNEQQNARTTGTVEIEKRRQAYSSAQPMSKSAAPSGTAMFSGTNVFGGPPGGPVYASRSRSLFGTQTNAAAPIGLPGNGGGLFGSSSTGFGGNGRGGGGGGGIFGNSSTGGTAFGNSNVAPSAPPKIVSASLFGSSNTASPAFGSSSSPFASSSSAFGSSSSPFGSKAPPPPPPASGLFGAAPAAAPSGGSLFGAAPAAAPAAASAGGGLFGGGARSAPLPQSSTVDALQDITTLQTFSGSWQWSPQLEKVIDVRRADAESAIRASGLSGVDRGDVLATVCALVFLKLTLAEDKEAWEMMADKARMWLEEQLGSQEEVARWENALESLLDVIA